MDVRQLRNFLAVSEFRNFTRAAASLHLSQPALSHSIAQLERDLGTRLFERRKRSVELTTAGEALLPAARRAVRALPTHNRQSRRLRAFEEAASS